MAQSDCVLSQNCSHDHGIVCSILAYFKVKSMPGLLVKQEGTKSNRTVLRSEGSEVGGLPNGKDCWEMFSDDDR